MLGAFAPVFLAEGVRTQRLMKMSTAHHRSEILFSLFK